MRRERKAGYAMKNKDCKFFVILIILIVLNIIDAIATAFWEGNINAYILDKFK